MTPVRRLRGVREVSLFSPSVDEVAGRDERPIPGDDAFRLIRGWLASEASDELFTHLQRATTWLVERRTMYDRVVDVPREQAWYGERCEEPWTRELAAARVALETFARTTFGYVLLNRYRDGNDSVAWHSDRARAGMPEPLVASLTLGATRAFDIRPKDAPGRVVSLDLDCGDLVIMTEEAQIRYEHRVPKDPRIRGERINLTFRRARDA